MNSLKRFVLVLALLMVAVVPFASVRAQEVPCTLAAADCKMLTTADSNLGKFTSFQQDFEFSFKASANGQTPDISATGTGVFQIDPTAASGSDPTAAMGSLKLTLDASGSAKGTGSSSDGSGKVSLVIVDGVAYFKAGDTGWQGVKLSDVLTQAMAAQGSMMGGLGGAGGATSGPQAQIMQLMSDPSLMSAIAAIPNIKGFITLTKGTAPDLEGQKIASFTYALDFSTLATAKELIPVVKAIVKATSPTAPDMTDEQIAQFGQMGAMILKDVKFSITRWVGETDMTYHGLGINLDAKIDPSIMGGKGSPATVTLSILVKLTKIGQSFDVKAPAGAKMITMPAPAK